MHSSKTCILKFWALLVGLVIPFCIQSQETMTWCAYYNWSPWIYATAEGYEGILVEELRFFEQEHGIETKAVVIDNWKRCQLEVANGHIDIILGANKTPEREKILHYSSEPAFINKSTLSAYASIDNERVKMVKTLEGLKKYRLSMIRGNSFGGVVDNFVSSLDKTNLVVVNSHEQVLKLVALKRLDYFLSPDDSYLAMLEKYREEAPKLKEAHFKQIFSMQRETPAYIAFSKKGPTFSKFHGLWIKTIRDYYASVNVAERIEFHIENSIRHKK